MKILIISGFLGAGKTTFIKEMAKKTNRDFVVMENEYGEIPIDGGLLGQEQLNIWELTEGCICCSTKSDFASSVLTIANTLDPDYLIVEPTGVGVLSNVIRNIQQIAYERISLLSSVTIVDAYTYDRCMAEYGEIFEDQIRCAGTIVISKNPWTSPGDAAPLVGRLRELNSGAEILSTHYSLQDPDWWELLLRRDFSGAILPPQREEAADLDNLGLSGTALPGSSHLIVFLEDLIRGEYGDICRAKGVIRAGGCFLKFDVVGERYSITGFSGGMDARSVFIGRDLKKNRLRKLLLPGFVPKPGPMRPQSPSRAVSRGKRAASDLICNGF